MKARSIALILLTLGAALPAEELSLDAYLGQVRQQNPTLKAQQAQDAAYALAAKEPLTAFSPQLNAQLQRYDDETEPAVNLLSPNRTLVWSGDVGLNKLFGTGTYVGVDFKTDRSQIDFPSSPLVGNVDNQGAAYSLSISQPLWRNWMASELDAGVQQAAHGADAARAGLRYAAQAQLFQARQAYVQLITLRQVELIQAESLERNNKILEWTQRKYADNLADKVDVLQVEAAIRQVALALNQTREDEAKAGIHFNALRGQAVDAPIGDLQPLSVPESLPVAKGDRQDLAAAKAALLGSAAAVESVKQRFTPDLSVFANVGMNERDPSTGEALGGAFKFDHPSSTVGIKFSTSLDWSLYRSVLQGAKKAQGAGAGQVEAKSQEIAQDWQQLQASWDSVKQRLSLAAELEGLQREKADREKVRYRDGRTTNFQVLRFEDDYNLSRVQTLQLTALANVLAAQARYYNGDDQPW